MAKKITLSKSTLISIKDLIKTLSHIKNIDEFEHMFADLLLSEVRKLKDCSESSIVEYYISEFKEELSNTDEFNSDIVATVISHVRGKLVDKYTANKYFDNNIDIYFNEVKKEYIKHPVTEQDELEMIPENRDVFIKNNLKLVIECAKRYTNLGVPFEDLIQAGNYGLLVAWDKYDKDRAILRKKIIAAIENSQFDEFSYEDAVDIIKDAFVYSKNLDQTIKLVPNVGFGSKALFIQWVKKNVKTAVFASVAFQWIRAHIVIELNKYSKIIRPKKIKDENNKMVSESVTVINLDSINPHTQDCYHDDTLSEVTQEEFIVEDEYIENHERNDVFKAIVNDALYKLGATERRILKKRYGIGLPYQLSVNEIAESENLTSNNVKYILTNSLKIIAQNINEQDKQVLLELIL